MTFLLNWKHLQQFFGTSRMIELGPKTFKLEYSDPRSTQSDISQANCEIYFQNYDFLSHV